MQGEEQSITSALFLLKNAQPESNHAENRQTEVYSTM